VQHIASEPSGIDCLAMPWLRQSDWPVILVVHIGSHGKMGLVVDKVTYGKAFPPVLQDSLLSVIHTILHTHNSFIYHQCNVV